MTSTLLTDQERINKQETIRVGIIIKNIGINHLITAMERKGTMTGIGKSMLHSNLAADHSHGMPV